MELIDQHVESLIFTSGQPISEADITTSIQRAIDESISKEKIDASIERLIEKYGSDQYAFEIVPISKGYHFMTKGAFHTTVGEHLKVISKKKLSRAALETLSIVAYKQPVTRVELEAIRGVSCDYTIQKLMEKELVEMQGRAEGPGRPLLYGTSEKFMDYFGIKDLKDLPKPKDFEMPETEVGEPAPIEVVVPKEGSETGESEAVEEVMTDSISEEASLNEATTNETATIESEISLESESDEIESMLEVSEVRSEDHYKEELSQDAIEISAKAQGEIVENGSSVESESAESSTIVPPSEEIIEIHNSSEEE